VLCGYCHLVFHPTCLDPLTGVENWDELAELNAIEYAVKYATKTPPGDYVIDCAPPVAGGAAAAPTELRLTARPAGATHLLFAAHNEDGWKERTVLWEVEGLASNAWELGGDTIT
jgi:hypothetical protein